MAIMSKFLRKPFIRLSVDSFSLLKGKDLLAFHSREADRACNSGCKLSTFLSVELEDLGLQGDFANFSLPALLWQ